MSRARVVWAWGTQHRPLSVRSCAPGLRVVGPGQGRPQGGASRHCEGRLRSGARPPSAACPHSGLSGSATHVLLARVCGCGGLALSVWLACPVGGFVPRGWLVAVPGGWPPTVVGGVWCQALSPFWAPVIVDGQPGPAARVSRARVVWAWGTEHRPHSLRSCEPALRAVEVAGGRLRGGVPCAVVRGVSGQALVLPRLPVHRASCRGLLLTCCGRGCAGVGARHCPFGLHALQGAACRGGAGGCPGQVAFQRWEGRVVSGAVPLLAARSSLWAGSQDPLPMCPGHGWCGSGGTSTGPTACALASQRCALWGWQEGVPGGGALCHCEGRLRSGACPPPAACPQGKLWGSAAQLLRARVCGRGGPGLSLWLACPWGGCVPRGWWVAVLGGRPSGVGRGLWCRALSLSWPPVPRGRRPGPVF